jgi:hypothetical protein
MAPARSRRQRVVDVGLVVEACQHLDTLKKKQNAAVEEAGPVPSIAYAQSNDDRKYLDSLAAGQKYMAAIVQSVIRRPRRRIGGMSVVTMQLWLTAWSQKMQVAAPSARFAGLGHFSLSFFACSPFPPLIACFGSTAASNSLASSGACPVSLEMVHDSV